MSTERMRAGRKLNVNGVRWVWRVGQAGGVVAYSESGERRFAWAWDLMPHKSSDEFNRGKRKIHSGGMLTPKHVCEWLAKRR